MYRLVYFTVAVILTRVLADDSEESCEKLREYVNKTMICCEEHPVKFEFMDKLDKEKLEEDMEECKESSAVAEGKKCSEREKCVAKTLGWTKENGEVDEEAVKKSYEEVLEAKAFDDINKYCFERKPKDKEMCFFKHVEKCTGIHYIRNCKKWSDDDSCKEMKDKVDEWSKKYS